MTTTARTPVLPDVPIAAPQVRDRRIELVRAGARLWRVVDRQGRIAGHLRHVDTPYGVRFRAERMHAATGRLVEAGEFWSADEAIACLRA